MNEEIEFYKDNWKNGVYHCAKCGQPLFESDSKFESGTVWPSFRKALPGAVTTMPDYSLDRVRTELLCSKCGEHLGHVFEDGRECGDAHQEAGLRH